MPFLFEGYRDYINFSREDFTPVVSNDYVAIFLQAGTKPANIINHGSWISENEVLEIPRVPVTADIFANSTTRQKIISPRPIIVSTPSLTPVFFDTVLLIDAGDFDDDRTRHLDSSLEVASYGPGSQLDLVDSGRFVRRRERYFVQDEDFQDFTFIQEASPGLTGTIDYQATQVNTPPFIKPGGRFPMGIFQRAKKITITNDISANIVIGQIILTFS